MTIKFEAGKTYATRSICDADMIVSVTVARRTEKTIVTDEGKRLRISVYDGVEQVKPWGSYSMAPIISADKVAEEDTPSMRPLLVHVHWSESGQFKEGQDLPFWTFEDMARRAAMSHQTGGYLKTKVRVSFDEGSTYECRIDLAADDEHGFQHHIEHSIEFMESEAGARRRESWPSDMVASYERLHKQWKRMDFTRPEGRPTAQIIPFPVVA